MTIVLMMKKVFYLACTGYLYSAFQKDEFKNNKNKNAKQLTDSLNVDVSFCSN